MATDYVLFVHGVKNRNRSEFEQACQTMLSRIRPFPDNGSRTLKPICLFWGDLNIAPQQRLLRGLEASPAWRHLLFQNFRAKEILEFVGDAALYLSRHVGSQVVVRVKDTALKPLEQAEMGDRLHLITHSMGTVILFDLLFAGRWEDPRLDQDVSTQAIRQTVSDIRNVLFGMGKNPGEGIPIASIHTMGSPIALFSLLSVTGESSHDLTANLKELLQNLYHWRGEQPLPWRNFIHPGDPIAYPLQGLVPDLLQNAQLYVQTQDVITENKTVWINLGLIPLLWGGDAHGSYWQSQLVAKTIGDVIR